MVRKREAAATAARGGRPLDALLGRVAKAAAAWRASNGLVDVDKLRRLLSELCEAAGDEEEPTTTGRRLDDQTCASLLILYQATRSPADRLLLRLLAALDARHFTSLAGRFSPPAFGAGARPLYADLAANGLGLELAGRPTAEQCVACLEPKRLWYSAMRFPQDEPAADCGVESPQSDAASTSSSLAPDDDYDSRFLLPLFAHLTGESQPLDYRLFVEHNCLAYTFAALTSAHDDVRALAYLVLWQTLRALQQDYAHAADGQGESGKFAERGRYVFLLKLLRNSLQAKNQRLSTVHGHFMARVSKLLLHAEDLAYWPVANFLLCKAAMDMENVPELFKMMRAESAHTAQRERQWILTLLADAVRTRRDYAMLENRGGLCLLWSHFASPLATDADRALVMRITKAAGGIGRRTRSDMCGRLNLTAFLAAQLRSAARPPTRWELGFLADIAIVCVVPVVAGDDDNRKGGRLAPSARAVDELLVRLERALGPADAAAAAAPSPILLRLADARRSLPL